MSMFETHFWKLFTTSAALLGACSGPDSMDTANLQQKGGGWYGNGPDLVSGRIHGELMQGIGMRDNRPAFIVGALGNALYPITKTTYRDLPVLSVSAMEGWLRVTYQDEKMVAVADKKEVAGLSFEFTFTDLGGKVQIPYKLTVKDVGDSGSGSSHYGMLAMVLSYTDSSGQVIDDGSLCNDSDKLPEPAVSVPGHQWQLSTGNMIASESTISFACRSAAVAGCMEYGYEPWTPHLECNDVSNPANCHPAVMWDILQACTRLKRADYCGTGVAHTLPKTSLWPADWLDPTVTNSARVMLPTLEAIWGLNGVSCIVPENLRHEELLDQDLSCSMTLASKPRCTWERPTPNVLADSIKD